MRDSPADDATVTAVFRAFLLLGLTAFGGPVAHLGYFRDTFVVRRAWLDERTYADLVALCQFLPGPASSQVGMAIGLLRAGYAGAAAAWIGFTLPSAVLMILLGLGITHFGSAIPSGALHGLKIAAVAVVAQAVWGMARQHCRSPTRLLLMLAAAAILLVLPAWWVPPLLLVLGALVGRLSLKPVQAAMTHAGALRLPVGTRAGVAWLLAFGTGCLALPLAAACTLSPALQLVDSFYRAGSLVFGGGHVVLPLLQAEVVPSGWVDNDVFLAGYGAAQAMPGPLFSFAAYLGAVVRVPPSGWLGGLIALLAIFLPSFLLVAGVLPFWQRLRSNRHMQAAQAGINAAVVGILAAALYDPVWVSAVLHPRDAVLAALAWLGLGWLRWPPWLVVMLTALAGTWWLQA